MVGDSRYNGGEKHRQVIAHTERTQSFLVLPFAAYILLFLFCFCDVAQARVYFSSTLRENES